MTRTGRPTIPTEIKHKRGMLRPGRSPKGASLTPLEPLDADGVLTLSLADDLDE